MPIKLKASIPPIWPSIEYLPHQKTGIQWMLNKERKGTDVKCVSESTVRLFGGIQADEMGLGKTIQMVATMRANPKERTLIILPVALQETWIGVLVRAGLKVMTLKRMGSSYLWGRHSTCLNSGIISGAGSVYVTNYEKVNRYPSLFMTKFDRIVLDEAHKIANNSTSNFRAICNIECDIHWALTGTPIVNSWNDLRSLIIFLGIPNEYMPSRFGSQESHIGESARLVIHRSMDSLRSSIPSAPPVPVEHTHRLDFATDFEADFYRGVQGAIKSSLSSYKDDLIEPSQGSTFKLYLRLRQISLHPDIYIQSRRKAKGGCSYTRPLFSKPSTKFLALERLIRSEKDMEGPSPRYIVFCQFTEEMRILKKYLTELEDLNLIVETFQGGMTETQRIRTLDRAKSMADVFLIQLQAGGCGLNLQEFNRVVFMSPWWTTALMNQAIARAVRIGQKDVVHIHKFILNEENTINIDEAMLEKAEAKNILLQELFDEVSPV
jgi:transcription termination factor 2